MLPARDSIHTGELHMETMTTRQLMKFVETAEQKGMTPAKFQNLLGSGLPADLMEADPSAINRDDFRKFLGLSPLEFYALVNFGLTLTQMIAEAHFDWVNDNITPERFPVVGRGTKKYKFKIYEPKRNISSEDATERMRSDGFPAARHEVGLAFAREFPNEQLKRPIALLGLSAEWRGARVVVCLGRLGAKRDLHFSNWRFDWSGHWGFLGAQEVSVA